MKITKPFLLLLCFCIMIKSHQGFGLNIVNSLSLNINCTGENTLTNNPPVAVDDTIIVPSGCSNATINFNLLKNDYDPENDRFVLSFIYSPAIGQIKVDCEGNFTYTAPNGFLGTTTTSYIICETENQDNTSEAKIVIQVKNDYDNDGIADDFDSDDDNDGILDNDDGINSDSDEDGIPNYLDIDSDNDGIPDNIEAQPENGYTPPLWTDTDKDGWDDSYDADNGGNYFTLADTDHDGTPDFLDTDSDNDGKNDLEEAFSVDLKNSTLNTNDEDRDGLDDKFDNIEGWSNSNNPVGSNVTLPDSDNNGTRDWRDKDGKNIKGGNENALHASDVIFKVYPNPASDVFSVEVVSSFSEETIEMEIINMSGKIIYKSVIKNPVSGFSAGKLVNGAYLVRLATNSNFHTHRLIVKK